jgi:hypothetical protein
MKARLAELERLLSRAVGNESAEFQCGVMHWLMRQEEYRRFARELFERIGNAEEPQLSSLISAEEWACLGEWIERAESSVLAGLKAGS